MPRCQAKWTRRRPRPFGRFGILLLPACLSTAAAILADEPATTPAPATVELMVGASWPIMHATRHVQGLCVADEWFWISSVDKAAKTGFVFRVDRSTQKVVAERKLAIGAQYHPGGMQLRGDDLWIPLAEYRPRSTSTMLRLDAMSLETRSQFTVDDHLGAVAVAEDGTLFAANWDARHVYVFSADGVQLRRADSQTGVAYQDWESHDGRLLATGLAVQSGEKTAVVDVLNGDTFKLEKRILLRGAVRSGGSNFAREGLSVYRGNLYLLPEDGPHTTVYEFTSPAPLP